ncbi:MAG TPA: tetratricopeptide repeat protein [Candidatus Binatia bacterium]|jgi:cytochrome c-type biogenesis protein CcmH/NrfG
MSDAPVRPGRRTAPLHAVAIVLVTVVTYAGSLDGAFVSDDVARVRDNPLVASLSAANVRGMFTTFDDSNYIPIKVLSLAIDRQLFGPEPTGFHVTNVALHAGCALLVYAILLRLGLVPLAACLTALAWAVHPLQVESVAWISERKNVLSGLFFFAAFLAYLSHSARPRAGAYAAYLGLYLLALLTKMNTMVLPAICLAYEALLRRRLDRRHLLVQAPPLALAALVGWINLHGNTMHGQAWWGGGPVVTWLTSTVVLFRYLRRVVLPVGLEPLYDVPLHGSPLDPPVLLALVGIAALGGVTLWAMRRRPREAFWLLWFGITLAPMLNVAVPFRSLMNDRYMYLALLGPLALTAFVVADLPSLRRPATAAACTAIAACAWLSVRQVEVWSNTVSLWTASAVRRPLIGGDPVYRRTDYEQRVAAVEQALAVRPQSGALHNNLGELYYESGRLPEALGELETANRLTPDEPTIVLNLGRAYLVAGRTADAETALVRATALSPYQFMNHLYLARLHLFGDHDAAKARAALDAGLRVQPDAAPALGREREALARLEAASRPPAH